MNNPSPRPKLGYSPSLHGKTRKLDVFVQPYYVAMPALAMVVFAMSAMTQLPSPSIPDAQAFAPSANLHDTHKSDQLELNHSETIVFREGGGTIIGQMARISQETDQMKDIRMATVAKEDRRHLLTIIGKY